MSKKTSNIWSANNSMHVIKPFPGAPGYREPFRHSVFQQKSVKKDSFEGLKYDVWNNKKFTTVFCWDENIHQDNMSYYHTCNWQSNIPETYPND